MTSIDLDGYRAFEAIVHELYAMTVLHSGTRQMLTPSHTFYQIQVCASSQHKAQKYIQKGFSWLGLRMN